MTGKKILVTRRENFKMTDKVIENNQVSITGKIVTADLRLAMRFTEKDFIPWIFWSRGLSDSEDRIHPVMVSERLIDVDANYEGEYVSIYGQFRSYNRHEETQE